VRAVRVVLFAELRHRWRSWLALALLVALVSGVAMAATTAGRRTESAFPNFLAAHGVDAIGYGLTPLPALATLPEVASLTTTETPAAGTPRCDCAPINPDDFGVVEAGPAKLHRLVKLVSGRFPDPSSSDQVLASFSLVQAAGVHVGSVVHVPFYGSGQAAAAQAISSARPDGPDVALHVVGIEAAEYEFPSVGTPTEALWATPAFARTYNSRIYGFFLNWVTLRHGAASQARFQIDAVKLHALGTGDEDTVATEIEVSLHPQAVGWWVLAALAGLAGLLAIAQAFARQTRVAAESYPTLSALGLEPRELALVNLGRAFVASLAGAAGGVVVAIALSPLAPVGEARIAETSTGVSVDPVVIGLGVAITVIATLAVSAWPSLRSARVRASGSATPARATSVVVNRLAAAGAPPSAVVGVRRALERGQGRSAVPVATALIGTALAVLALTATAVFGASLSHLTSTPALYGQEFNVYFDALSNDLSSLGPLLSGLKADPNIVGITRGASSNISINHVSVDAIAGSSIRGPLLLVTVDGRLPASPDEVALGGTTLRQVGAHIGSLVRITAPKISGGSRTSVFRVVGTTVFPTSFGVGGLGNGAVFTIPGLVAAQCTPGPGAAACEHQTAAEEDQVLLVRGSAGPAGAVAVAGFARRYPGLVTQPTPPNNLVNFGEAVNFPLIIGLVLALFGAATLLHMLVVSAARRRPETGLLKALGFVRHQVAAAVAWQATAIALVGVVVGIPLGIAVGQAVWRIFADNLGVVPDPVVAGWVMAAIALGVVAVANLLAIGPALAASRLRPSELLRDR